MLTIYVADFRHLVAIEETLERHLADSPPARSIVEVSRLPRNAGIMMDAVVSVPDVSDK